MTAFLPPLAYLALVAFVAARRGRGGRPTMLDMCVTYAPGVFWLLPLAWLVPLAMRNASPCALLLGIMGAGAVLLGLMGPSVGPSAPSTRDGPRLRVATFNLFGGSLDIHRCLAFLVKTQADVVFLQEAWWTFAHHHTADITLPAIEAAFAGWYVFRSDDAHEMMIISRLPLHEPREVRLNGRPCLTATIETTVGEVRIINVHLDPPATGRRIRESGKPPVTFLLETEAIRRRQGEALATLVREGELPTVLAGDFNAPPFARARLAVTPLLTDAFAVAGRGYGHTFPRVLPMWRIDYVLISAHWTAERCAVGRVGGSDHLPLVADLRLTRPALRGRG